MYANKIKTWAENLFKEKPLQDKVDGMLDDLNEMDIIDYALIEKIPYGYRIIAQPFYDTRIPRFNKEVSNSQELLEQLEIFYEKTKSKDNKLKRDRIAFKTSYGLMMLIVFGHVWLECLLVAGFLAALHKAGLTDEARSVALDIIKTTITELISWIP